MIKVFVMQTCPDCASIKREAQGDTRFQIIDIGEHVRNLKQFLALRDTNPAFDSVRQRGSVGIPCFVLEDGTITFSQEEAFLSLPATSPTAEDGTMEEGASCSIDGKGC